MDDLVERMKAEIADQRNRRGTILDYGDPDPLLVESLARITALEASLAEAEGRVIAARRQALEEAAKACEAERLSEPQDENDAAYDRAIDDCVEAIRALERGDHLKEG